MRKILYVIVVFALSMTMLCKVVSRPWMAIDQGMVEAPIKEIDWTGRYWRKK